MSHERDTPPPLSLSRVQQVRSVKLAFQDLKDLKAHKARVVVPSWGRQYDDNQ